MEVTCADARCTANSAFTPINVVVTLPHTLEVCAYSGCWRGRAKITNNAKFITAVATNLNAQGGKSGPDSRAAALVITRDDMMGVMRFESFAQPMFCQTK